MAIITLYDIITLNVLFTLNVINTLNVNIFCAEKRNVNPTPVLFMMDTSQNLTVKSRRLVISQEIKDQQTRTTSSQEWRRLHEGTRTLGKIFIQNAQLFSTEIADNRLTLGGAFTLCTLFRNGK